MKYAPYIFLVALFVVLAGLCATGPPIEWEFGFQPVWQLNGFNESLQFGLRNDGVVVWRKIILATNSPAEFTNTMAVVTQMQAATTLIGPRTAVIRQPGYTSPPQLPGGRNATYPTNVVKLPPTP